MSAVVAGVLLPESLLSEPWFRTFAFFVAFNTIVYLGLTVSKLAPWPAQIRPARVRAILPPGLTEDTTMKDIPRTMRLDPAGDFSRARIQTACDSIPLALSLVGGLVIAISALQLVFVDSTIEAERFGVLVVAIGMLIWAQVCAHSRIAPGIIIWSWAVLMSALIVFVSIFGIVYDNEIALTYAVMLFIILPSVAVTWPASLVAGAFSLVVITIAGVAINKLDSLQWSIAALAAFAMGLLGLQVRRYSVDRLLLEEMRSQRLATTDPLTHALTRSALGVLVPGVVEAAGAADVPVHGIHVDVRNLTGINADYGIEYGDAVLRVVAQAVKEVAPRGDLVARWEGDCFLAVGPGPAPSAEEFAAAVEGVVRDRGIALGKRPVSVATGVISMSAAGADLESLANGARASSLP
jgi:diguanylate cyclase (GGDEF)-like protein